eukprot:c53647_g1_i1.p2 GENE.c53647_g1_i1~~c53647_g1_i1.p2  ORF type:complete len:200 (-),score=64.42 c53647_g1_i1:95-694(-)
MADDEQQPKKRQRIEGEAENEGGELVAAEENTEAPKKPKLKFRNYMPHDTNLDFEAIKAPPQVDLTTTLAPIKDSVAKLREMSGIQQQKTITGFVKDSASETIETVPAFVETETALEELAPKKANWDLKRDVTKKLEKLKKRTDRAIMAMLRDKVLKEQASTSRNDEASDEEGQGEALVAGINNQAKFANEDSDNDDDD